MFLKIIYSCAFLVLISACTDSVSNIDRQYFSVKIGFPPDTMKNFNNFTDTMSFPETIKSSAQISTIDFFNQFLSSDSLSFTNEDKKLSIKLSDSINVYSFGKHFYQFDCYEHNRLGFVYGIRTDWELEEYGLLKDPKMSSDNINELVKLCRKDYRDRREKFLFVPDTGNEKSYINAK